MLEAVFTIFFPSSVALLGCDCVDVPHVVADV